MQTTIDKTEANAEEDEEDAASGWHWDRSNQKESREERFD